MTTRASRVLLWFFVINLGMAFGAGLYEHRIVIPDWIPLSEGEAHWSAETVRRDDTGLRFWAFVTTGPLTLLTLANLYAAWRSAGEVRRWWLFAAVAALAERALTFGYFIPTMVGLMGASDSPESVAIATRWSTFNYVRHAVVLVAWLSALKTFSLVYQRRS